MPKGLTPKQEKAWAKAKKVVQDQKGKKKLKKKDWPLVMHITKEMSKSASSVRIEPFESLVDKAVKKVEEHLGSGALSQVKTIVLEPSNPGYYGRVKSDEPDTIYLSFNRIKTELANSGEEAVVRQLAETISHELGHLESKFTGGENPAESKAHSFLAKHDAKEAAIQELHVNAIVRLAHQLDQDGHTQLADMCDAIFKPKVALAFGSNPTQMVDGIVALISYLSDRVKPENRRGYIENFSSKLTQLAGENLPGRKNNPGAGIGAVSSLIKNLLSGQDPATVNTVLRKVITKLRAL